MRLNAGADVAFFLQDLDGGGAERAVIGLAGDIRKQGYSVDLVVGDAEGDYRLAVPSTVALYDFRTRSPLRVFGCLVRYLRVRRPAAVMSALDVANLVLVLAAKVAGYKGRVVISQRAVVRAGRNEHSAARRLIMRFMQRMCFPRADAVISNSVAAAAELRELLGVRPQRITVIHNAVDVELIGRLAIEPLQNDWVRNSAEPLIVSVGSLTKRKDMETLIQAFGIVARETAARLVIVGKGSEQQNLEALISSLELVGRVCLAGFDANPYRWMAAAAVFVSSSTDEGFPNVIAEALALGRPVVATDCPGDTAELLQRGKWGHLVPMRDPVRMASAILAALKGNVLDGRVRAADFAPARVVAAYLHVLLPQTDVLTSRLTSAAAGQNHPR